MIRYKRDKGGFVLNSSVTSRSLEIKRPVFVRVCSFTIEKIALALEYLADLKGPDLTHPWVRGVKHEGLHGGVGRPRSENELTRITFYILLQTQTADLGCKR